MTPEPTTTSNTVSETILVVDVSPGTFDSLTVATGQLKPEISLRATADIREALSASQELPAEVAVLVGAGEYGKAFEPGLVQTVRDADRPVVVFAFTDAAHLKAVEAGIDGAMVVQADPNNWAVVVPQITTAIQCQRERLLLKRARKLIESNYAAHRKLAHDLNNSIGVMWLNLHSLKKQCARINATELSAFIESIERETRTIATLASKVSELRDEQKLG